ncbi:MAG: REP-associated tyrosine transposase [Gemmatimonas sp.]
MARQPRKIVPGQPHHFTQRGINRCATFVDAGDVARCIDSLQKASKKFECKIHAYVIMTNHLHVLATPEDAEGAAKFGQSFGVRYSRYFNARNRRTGSLWGERYFSELIDSERYFFACARYIELNPVRANIVAHPAEYTASSFRHNALGHVDPLITPHPLYQSLAPTAQQRAAAYSDIFQHYLDSVHPARPTDSAIRGLRRWVEDAER